MSQSKGEKDDFLPSFHFLASPECLTFGKLILEPCFLSVGKHNFQTSISKKCSKTFKGDGEGAVCQPTLWGKPESQEPAEKGAS